MLTDRVAIGAMAAGLLSSTIGFSFRLSESGNFQKLF